MRRTKKFYEEKKLRRLYNEYINSDSDSDSTYERKIKVYRYFVSKTLAPSLIYDDLVRLLNIISKNNCYELPNIEPQKINYFRTTLLKQLTETEYNELDPCLKSFLYRNEFSTYPATFKGGKWVYVEQKHVNYILNKKYFNYLYIDSYIDTYKGHLFKLRSEANPEVYNKLKRENLWPKINKILGNSHSYDPWDDPTITELKSKVSKNEMKDQINEYYLKEE